MLRAFVWTTAAALTGLAAVFVPIDPAVLQTVGLSSSDTQPLPANGPVKIVSRPTNSTDRAVVRVVNSPAVSPYGARSGTNANQRIAKLAIASPPKLVVKPAIVEPPVAPVSAAVVRNLQSELRRVGCYHGRIDGDWGPASRFAMASFIKSANAALPTDRPDAVLLSLVRRHPGGACGASPSTTRTLSATAALVSKVKSQKVSGWQARVSPSAVPTPKLVYEPIRLTGAPRIVRSAGPERRRVTVADPFAHTPRRPPPFAERRMSLGVAVPAPTEARRPVTGPDNAAPNSYVRRRTPFRQTERQYRRPIPRARRANVKRRRYYRRRARSRRSWRRAVFPGLYHN